MQKVRWGLLPTAHINRRVIPAIRDSGRGELVAVASRSQQTAQAYASQWGIPHAFGSYESMLESGRIDAVYISLPNHLHCQWSLRAMEAGVHVLCEKPFALTLEEVDAMIDASRRHERMIAEAFMYRHHPQTKILGEWIQSGRLGEVCLVKADFHFTIEDRENIRLVPEYGGGSLWDVGVYPVSLAQYVFGQTPEQVSGMQWVGASGVDETFSGVMRYPGGGLALFSSSFRTPLKTHAEIIGNRGSLSLNFPFNWQQGSGRRMTFHPAYGEPEEVPVPEVELYSGEVEDMQAAILDGKPPYLTLEETRNHIRTTLALYESAQSGTVIRM